MQHPDKKEIRPRRERRLSRRARFLLLLSVAVIAAAALVWLLPTIRERIPSRLAQSMKLNLTFRTLDTGDVKVLDSIAVTRDGGESYTLRYRDGQLSLETADGTAERINESYTEEIVEAATSIAVEDTVTSDISDVSDRLADMGLDPPRITVRVGYADGRTVEIQLGDQVPGTTYHYYRWSGDQGLYMCDSGIYDAFDYTAHMLLPVEQPTLVPALIDRLTLTTQSGGRMALSFVSDGADATLGTLKEPYRYPMDSEATTTLLTALKNFRLGTKLGEVTTENRAQYGLDAPAAVIAIHQQQGLYGTVDAEGVWQTTPVEEQDIRLTLGAKDGDYFYFCEYAGVCYRVSSFLVTALVEAAPEKYLTAAPADMGAARIASIAVQMGEGALDVRATYTEQMQADNQIQTDSSGNPVYDVSVTVNGEAASADAFDALVARLGQMTVSGRLTEPVTPTGTPRWQLTLTTTGGETRTLAAYPMDAFSDVLTVDGVALHYLNAEALQIALAELYPVARLTTPKEG